MDRRVEGELKLWGQCLIQGLEDASGRPQGVATGREAERARENARRWLRSRRCKVGDFAWACELFELDPDVIRRAMTGRRRAYTIAGSRAAGAGAGLAVTH